MLESLFIGLIVIAAMVYAAWALTPVTARNQVARRLASALEHRHATGAGAWIAARLRALAQVPAGGCGNCSAHAATPAERASRQARGDR